MSVETEDRPSRSPRRSFVRFGWLAIFSLNAVMPAIMARELTQDHGRVGMAAAILLIAAAGYLFCSRYPRSGRWLIWGGITTLCPVLGIPWAMFLAGILGAEAAEALGLARTVHEPLVEMTSEWGGFVATIVTGSLLIAAGLIVVGTLRLLGWFLLAITSVGVDRARPDAVPTANGQGGEPR